jgi:hypothetical protein
LCREEPSILYSTLSRHCPTWLTGEKRKLLGGWRRRRWPARPGSARPAGSRRTGSTVRQWSRLVPRARGSRLRRGSPQPGNYPGRRQGVRRRGWDWGVRVGAWSCGGTSRVCGPQRPSAERPAAVWRGVSTCYLPGGGEKCSEENQVAGGNCQGVQEPHPVRSQVGWRSDTARGIAHDADHGPSRPDSLGGSLSGYHSLTRVGARTLTPGLSRRPNPSAGLPPGYDPR